MQIRCKQGGLEDKDPKIESGLVPKSCTYAVNQVVWRIRVPNLNLDLVPRSCKYGVNQVVWKIRDPKTGSGSSPNIMQKHSKPGSLKDQDPKSTVSKINFASWIRGFCRHASHPFFWRLGFRKLNLDLIPRSCKYAANQVVWRIRIQKLNLDLAPRSCK